MQAPLVPIDIKIVMGSDNNYQKLLNMQIDFTDNKEYVQQCIITNKFNPPGKDLVFYFDLYTQQNSQTQAYNYLFQTGKSPFQVLFNNRPKEDNKSYKFEIEKYEGFLRIVYTVIADPEDPIVEKVQQILSTYKNYDVHMQSHLSWELKGNIVHGKKNKTQVLVDYVRFEFVSNAFSANNFIECITTFNDIQLYCQYYLNNPFLQLLKTSKSSKLHIKSSSLPKLQKYYNKVSISKVQKQKKQKQKQITYINKGLFKDKIKVVMIYQEYYMIQIQGKYSSQDAFMALLRNCCKVLEKFVKVRFYYEEEE